MTKNTKVKNGDGSVRKLPNGKFECIIQSKYLNPKTGNPKRVKRVGNTEQDARNKAKMDLTAWEKEYERGKDSKINRSKTFGQYMEEFIDGEVKPGVTGSTYYTYIGEMKRNFYTYPISKYQLQMLNTAEFERYFNTLRATKSKRTCEFPLQMTRRCCTWLVERSLLKENYASMAKIKKEVSDEYDKNKADEAKKRKKVFTPDDIQKFYYAYQNNIGQYAVVVLFLLETGMRAGEFAALRNSSIDLEQNKIYIVEARSKRFKDNDKTKGFEFYVKVPKNGEERFVMMSDLCRECVLYMMEQTKLYCKNNPDDLLYPVFITGNRRQNSAMEVGFKSLCDKLGVDRDVHITESGNKKGLGLHSLRHTANTYANTAKNANVVNTAMMMGHKAIQVENIYTHPTEEALSSIVTPSQAVLEKYKKEEDQNKEANDKEMYEMYLKLKQKFES